MLVFPIEIWFTELRLLPAATAALELLPTSDYCLVRRVDFSWFTLCSKLIFLLPKEVWCG